MTQEWISVNDRLPSGGDYYSSQLVLTWCKRRYAPFVTFYWKRGKRWANSDSITHWMPLNVKTPKQ